MHHEVCWFLDGSDFCYLVNSYNPAVYYVYDICNTAFVLSNIRIPKTSKHEYSNGVIIREYVARSYDNRHCCCILNCLPFSVYANREKTEYSREYEK